MTSFTEWGAAVLLHICCAPDATVPWPALLGEGFEVDGFFYGGNIHPEGEWEMRRDSVVLLAEKLGRRVEISPYDPGQWFDWTSGLSGAHEGGERCRACFGAQLGASSVFARENGYGLLSTTLTISPHKDPALVNEIGEEVSSRTGVRWLPRVWRKNDGFRLSVERSREMGLYRQKYCGCVYSVRELVSPMERSV
ncbi:MAG: epoxyqueuosine reductase QueH [Synergistaceae bacterium]|jgi:predicted adenine nucleotide alpha hydrolase (AANH) superfamily ATPase|nr:epoxyqueuosine reductase QueH [Synergistaceae bacterium]